MKYQKPSAVDPATKGETENFWTRNVRLITFVICMVVFFGVCIGFSAYYIYDWFSEPADDRPEMTVSELQILAASPERINTKMLDAYRGEYTETRQNDFLYKMYQLDIEGRYTLWISFNGSNGELFDMTLTDSQTAREIDLLKTNADLDAFLQGSEAN